MVSRATHDKSGQKPFGPHRMSQRNHYKLSHLRAGIRPFRLYWYPRLRSTNTHAAELRRRGDLYAPAIVLTGHQIAGRGRGGNSWWSTGEAVTATFVVASEEHHLPQQIPLLAGLAVREAVAELTGIAEIQLKWPNDILFDGRKLAGLLCERVQRAELIGLGLNVNVDPRKAPQAMRGRITSLSHIAGEELDLTQVLTTIAARLHEALSRRGERFFSERMREYDRHHWLVGRKMSIVGSPGEPILSGRCQGVDSIGRLLLKSRTQLHRVIAGHVLMK